MERHQGRQVRGLEQAAQAYLGKPLAGRCRPDGWLDTTYAHCAR